MPKADATGLAPEKSAEQNPPALSSAPEGFLLCAASPISMVKSRSGGLGHSNAKTARRALQILRLLGPGGIPPNPIAKLRNSPGNNVRISGGKSVTRYTLLHPLNRNTSSLPCHCCPASTHSSFVKICPISFFTFALCLSLNRYRSFRSSAPTLAFSDPQWLSPRKNTGRSRSGSPSRNAHSSGCAYNGAV